MGFRGREETRDGEQFRGGSRGPPPSRDGKGKGKGKGKDNKGGKGVKGGKGGKGDHSVDRFEKKYTPITDDENPNYVHHVSVDDVRKRLSSNHYVPPSNPHLSVTPKELTKHRIDHFTDLDLPQSLADGLSKTGYQDPTPIQSLSIPVGLRGDDILTVAQTGSGKTLCFLLVMGASLMRSTKSGGASVWMKPSAIVITPTRELALQIIEHAWIVFDEAGLRTCGAYGGVRRNAQFGELENQCKSRGLSVGVDIVVGCPGRLNDLISQDIIGLQSVQFLVMDEADRLLEMGFDKEMDAIVKESGMPRDRQTMMYSATFDEGEIPYAEGYLKDGYVVVKQGLDRTLPDNLEVKLIEIDRNQYIQDEVSSLVRSIDKRDKVLIFVPTKAEASEWSREFKNDAVCLHGDMTQCSRERALEKYRDNKVHILIATDVAQRGIDVQGVTDVISVGAPNNEDDFLHRYVFLTPPFFSFFFLLFF